MAKSSKAKKITRRDAVVLLGASAIAAHGKPASARTQSPQKPSPKSGRPDRCGQPAVVTPYQFTTSDGQVHQAMLAHTCCDESRNAVFVGVGKPGKGVSAGGPGHLKPMTDRLAVDQLDEYCFMIWGLTEVQVNQARETTTQTLKLTLRSVK